MNANAPSMKRALFFWRIKITLEKTPRKNNPLIGNGG